MAGKNRPQNRRGSNKPSNRGPAAPKPQPQPVRAKGTQHKGPRPSGGSSSDKCCPMVAALVSARRGKFRLARRYAALSARLIAARII